MNHHQVIVWTAVLTIGIHLPGYTVHKEDACWMLSDDTGNALVGRFLKDSEDQARNQDFKRAAGKRWDAYKRLYIAESFCFAPENPHTNRVNNLKDLFLYDPLDPDQCFTGLHYNGWPTNELRWVLDTYYAHGGPKDEKALFYEMKYAARCGGDALK